MTYGFPDRVLAKLRYYDTYGLSVSSGSLPKQVMYMNSTYDPDYTGVGHQPLYRDTFAAVYSRYAVTKCTATVKFVNTAAVPIIVGCVIEDDATSSTTVDTLCEQSHGQHVILPPTAGSMSTHTFVVDWDCVDVLGIDPFTSESYKTVVAGSPSQASFLVIWGTTFDGSSTPITVSVELDQTVLWTQLSSPTQS